MFVIVNDLVSESQARQLESSLSMQDCIIFTKGVFINGKTTTCFSIKTETY